jgi:hypothetical protein
MKGWRDVTGPAFPRFSDGYSRETVALFEPRALRSRAGLPVLWKLADAPAAFTDCQLFKERAAWRLGVSLAPMFGLSHGGSSVPLQEALSPARPPELPYIRVPHCVLSDLRGSGAALSGFPESENSPPCASATFCYSYSLPSAAQQQCNPRRHRRQWAELRHSRSSSGR